MEYPKDALVFYFCDRNTGVSHGGLEIRSPRNGEEIREIVRKTKEDIAMSVGNLTLLESLEPVLVLEEPTEVIRELPD